MLHPLMVTDVQRYLTAVPGAPAQHSPASAGLAAPPPPHTAAASPSAGCQRRSPPLAALGDAPAPPGNPDTQVRVRQRNISCLSSGNKVSIKRTEMDVRK